MGLMVGARRGTFGAAGGRANLNRRGRSAFSHEPREAPLPRKGETSEQIWKRLRRSEKEPECFCLTEPRRDSKRFSAIVHRHVDVHDDKVGLRAFSNLQRHLAVISL